MNRFLGRFTRAVRKPWQMYPLGILFGLGFDTATEVALLFLAPGPPGRAAVVRDPLPAGALRRRMSLLDTIDGSFMNFAYGWAFSSPCARSITTSPSPRSPWRWRSSSGPSSCSRSRPTSSGCAAASGTGCPGSTSTRSATSSSPCSWPTWAVALAVWRFGRLEERWAAAGVVARARVGRACAGQGTMARCAVPLRHRRDPPAQGLRGARPGGAGGDGRRLRADRRPDGPLQAAGRTDVEIARQLALLGGVSAERFDAGRDDFRVAASEAYARLCPDDLSAHVAPGIVEVLETLDAREGVRLAVLTGNLEPIAHLKLEARRARALLRARPGRLRLRPRGPHRAARHRPGPGGRLPARADGDHRRHAARHRLRARRRGALHRGGHGPVHDRAAGGRGCRPRQRARAARRALSPVRSRSVRATNSEFVTR